MSLAVGPHGSDPAFTLVPYVPGMADKKTDKLGRTFEEWQSAEVRFATALADFVKGGQPKQVPKSAALELAELRGAADAKMHQYFKRSVH